MGICLRPLGARHCQRIGWNSQNKQRRPNNRRRLLQKSKLNSSMDYLDHLDSTARLDTMDMDRLDLALYNERECLATNVEALHRMEDVFYLHPKECYDFDKNAIFRFFKLISQTLQQVQLIKKKIQTKFIKC